MATRRDGASVRRHCAGSLRSLGSGPERQASTAVLAVWYWRGPVVEWKIGVMVRQFVAEMLTFVRGRRLMGIVLWAVMLMLVAVGELLPGNSDPIVWLSASRLSDKLVHLAAYAVVAGIAAAAMDTRLMLVCIAVSECVGIALEVGQHYVPGRSTDIYDVVANTVGVLVGAGWGLWVLHWTLKRSCTRPETSSATDLLRSS